MMLLTALPKTSRFFNFIRLVVEQTLLMQPVVYIASMLAAILSWVSHRVDSTVGDRLSFSLAEMAKHSLINAFMQHCIFPRCCFTSMDAIYCAKFINIIHNLKTLNFSSLICYDRVSLLFRVYRASLLQLRTNLIFVDYESQSWLKSSYTCCDRDKCDW